VDEVLARISVNATLEGRNPSDAGRPAQNFFNHGWHWWHGWRYL